MNRPSVRLNIHLIILLLMTMSANVHAQESTDAFPGTAVSASPGNETEDAGSDDVAVVTDSDEPVSYWATSDSVPVWFLGGLIGIVVLVQLGHILTGTAAWEPPEPSQDKEPDEPEPAAPDEPEAEQEAPVAELSDEDAIDLGEQVWRLKKRISQLPLQEHPKHRRRMENSVDRFTRIIDRLGVEVVDPVGRPFVVGWTEVEVISSERVDPWPNETDERPYIHETVRPIIRRHGYVISTGQVIVGEMG